MIKGIVLHRNFIALFSCVMGYSVWAWISEYQTHTMNYTIPIYFYNIDMDHNIISPESINLSLFGTRKNLYRVYYTMPAIHINAQSLTYGTQHTIIHKDDIPLPEHVYIASALPSIRIHYEKKK